MSIKRKLYEAFYPYWYGLRELMKDGLDILKEFKKPRMWSSILFAIILYGTYIRNFTLLKWAIPLFALVYFLRHKQEKLWKGELYEKDLNNNIDSDIVKEHYERYKKACYFSSKSFITFDEWKQQEITRIHEKHMSDQNAQHQNPPSF